MAKIDWSKNRERRRLAERGSEAIDGSVIPIGAPKPQPGKAALRAELAAAEAKITRIVRCECGHKGSAVIPAAKAHARLRCSKCGRCAE